ncbi:HlyD family efflux transporter periplasmic adaptor subunit [Limnohabitans sp. Rim47]|uniref:HlyD family efflux transporter periplasmic adaptor subunit n=1 Tax=Limnohabitans sp. Rim47 TaxID=1100721 RepID=UPI000308932C|nr:HlyD family efflux transporter periplasmic adaptor subunit [Limnohabitans sp. Rim47]
MSLFSRKPSAAAALSGRSIEDDERRTSRYLIRTMALVLAVALLWAASFQLDEITRGTGKVIPSSREQVIQSLDTGVLAEMLVHEGDAVVKGQVLLRIDDARTGPMFREAREKWLALSAQAARLQAEAYGMPLRFPLQVQNQTDIVKRETQAFRARRQALNEQMAAMQQSLVQLSAELELVAPLVKQGVMSQVELLRLKRQQADLQSTMAERRNRYLTEASNELVRVESELAQTRENTLAREDALRKTVIRTPMDGIVKNVQHTTLGAVIQSGQSILEIVPVQDEMVVEAYVKPSEVAFLKVNQPAVVKLSAFDFNKYGGLQGVLEHISPDTLTGDGKGRAPGSPPVNLEEGHYRILVRITDTQLHRHGMDMRASPGMSALVEIKTGQKTVLEYLLRPVQALTQALRER